MAVSQEMSRPQRMAVWGLHAHGPLDGLQERINYPVYGIVPVGNPWIQRRLGAGAGSSRLRGTCGDRWLMTSGSLYSHPSDKLPLPT